MTEREKLWLRWFGAVVGLTLMTLTVSWFVDEVGRLETQYQGLKSKVTQIQSKALAQPDLAPAHRWGELEAKLWPPGQAPSIVGFSADLRGALRRAGLELSGLSVVGEAVGRGRIEAQARGPIDRWFALVNDLSASHPKLLFHRVLMKKTEATDYLYTFEVGYATLP